MSKIAVIGAGLIGQGWATVFAQAGFDVVVNDTCVEALERASKAMETRIADLCEFDLVEPSQMPQIINRISYTQDLKAALQGAIYIQENGPERLEFKHEITELLDSIAKDDVPIGSSTSGISASRYCEDIAGRHRCMVVHPINPPHLIPAVELVPTPWTSKEIITKTNDLMVQCQRQTIMLKEEIDGFVVNRLQGALLQEAFKLVGQGIVSATDLDKAICDGLGLRWSFMGPMQTIHLNAPGGIVDYVERYGQMYRNFDFGPYKDIDWGSITRHKLNHEIASRTPITKIPEAQADRDRKLMALLRHKAQSNGVSWTR